MTLRTLPARAAAALALALSLFAAACLLAACDKPAGSAASPPQGGPGAPIRIATKPMTEQFILAEMLALLIEQGGMQAQITKGIGGGTANIHPVLLKGEFDLYPEYTGTAWLYVLKKPLLDDEQALMQALRQDYGQLGLQWVGLYGFNNTYGLAVRRELAQAQGLKTYSDLAPHADQYVFGAEYDFYEREDGYDALVQAYELDFARHVDMDIGLKYKAIADGQIDVMTIFTTDGQLSVAPITVLQDDKRFYPAYYAGTVVRSQALQQHPGLRDALMKMDGLISTEDMARLNHEVEGKGRGEREVAAEFLKAKGRLP